MTYVGLQVKQIFKDLHEIVGVIVEDQHFFKDVQIEEHGFAYALAIHHVVVGQKRDHQFHHLE